MPQYPISTHYPTVPERAPLPDTMSVSEEMEAIADSIAMMAPFQAARLHVLAATVSGVEPI